MKFLNSPPFNLIFLSFFLSPSLLLLLRESVLACPLWNLILFLLVRVMFQRSISNRSTALPAQDLIPRLVGYTVSMPFVLPQLMAFPIATAGFKKHPWASDQAQPTRVPAVYNDSSNRIASLPWRVKLLKQQWQMENCIRLLVYTEQALSFLTWKRDFVIPSIPSVSYGLLLKHFFFIYVDPVYVIIITHPCLHGIYPTLK